MTTLAATDWNPIVVALSAAIPGLFAAIIAYLTRRQLRTPSGPSVGTQTEFGHALAALNHAYLMRLLEIAGLEEPDPHGAVRDAEARAAKVINGSAGPLADPPSPAQYGPGEKD